MCVRLCIFCGTDMYHVIVLYVGSQIRVPIAQDMPIDGDVLSVVSSIQPRSHGLITISADRGTMAKKLCRERKLGGICHNSPQKITAGNDASCNKIAMRQII